MNLATKAVDLNSTAGGRFTTLHLLAVDDVQEGEKDVLVCNGADIMKKNDCGNMWKATYGQRVVGPKMWKATMGSRADDTEGNDRSSCGR